MTQRGVPRSARETGPQPTESALTCPVFVVAAPPLVRLRLRVPAGRVLPLLLATERCQVEEGPNAAEGFDATGCGEVRAKDAVAVAQEDAEAAILAVMVAVRLRRFRPDADVDVELALQRRVPRDGPTHPLSVRLDLRNRRAGHERKGGVAGVQVGEVADLVDEHRAAVAARVL